MSDRERHVEASGEEESDGGLSPLPASLVPRWLAALVLLALFAAGVASAWLILA